MTSKLLALLNEAGADAEVTPSGQPPSEPYQPPLQAYSEPTFTAIPTFIPAVAAVPASLSTFLGVLPSLPTRQLLCRND